MLKIKEPKAMAQIHAIREKIYRETKKMSIEEKLRYIHQGSSKIFKIVEKGKMQ